MKTILVAENNLVNRELLREILETGQYQVVEAENGQEALAKIEETEPDLVLICPNWMVMAPFRRSGQTLNSAGFRFWR